MFKFENVATLWLKYENFAICFNCALISRLIIILTKRIYCFNRFFAKNLAVKISNVLEAMASFLVQKLVKIILR